MQDKIMDNEYIRGYIKTELDTLLKLAVKIDELYVANVLASLLGAMNSNEDAENELARICNEFSKEMVKQYKR